jgi:hypothetical protein
VNQTETSLQDCIALKINSLTSLSNPAHVPDFLCPHGFAYPARTHCKRAEA